MTWFKVDDGFWSHPKTVELSAGAVALWVRAGAYCCQHLTDGYVLSRVTHLLDPSDERETHTNELVRSGLWIRVDNGFQFHDWAEYQESSDAVKRRRDQWKDRQRRARQSRQESRDSHANVTRDSRGDSLSPVPSRPSLSPNGDRGARRRAKRPLPDNWTPNSNHQAKADRDSIDLSREADKFRNSALAHDRRYVDWDRAFTNWLSQEWVTKRPGSNAPGFWKDSMT